MESARRSFAIAERLPLHKCRNNIQQEYTANDEVPKFVGIVDSQPVTDASTTVMAADQDGLFSIGSQECSQGL